MCVCVGNGRQKPGSTCIISGTAVGRNLSVTPKPCSSNKEAGHSRELIDLTATLLINVAETPAHECDGRGCSGFTRTSSTGPLWNLTCRPGSCQTRNRRLAPQGWWGDKQERGGRSRGCKRAAGWMTSVTPCFRFPWRQELTPQPPSYSFPLCSSHSPRTHARHGSRQTRAAGGAQQLCCSSPLLLFDFLPSTSVG